MSDVEDKEPHLARGKQYALLRKCSWYHGGISREEARQIINNVDHRLESRESETPRCQVFLARDLRQEEFQEDYEGLPNVICLERSISDESHVWLGSCFSEERDEKDKSWEFTLTALETTRSGQTIHQARDAKTVVCSWSAKCLNSVSQEEKDKEAEGRIRWYAVGAENVRPLQVLASSEILRHVEGEEIEDLRGVIPGTMVDFLYGYR